MASLPTLAVNIDTPSAAAGLGYLIVGDVSDGLVGTDKVAPDAVFVDDAASLRAMDIQRGSTSNTDALFHADTGTCTMVLNNRARAFDPLQHADVRPNRATQVVATWNATDYDLFNGAIQSFDLTYPAQARDAVTKAVAADGIRVLVDQQVDDFPQQLSGHRVDYLLSLSGWPATARDLADGYTVMPEHVGTVSAWSAATEAADSEWGEVYVAADGTFVFRDRQAIGTETRSTVSQATFGDGGGSELSYSDVQIAYDTAQIRNDVVLTYNEAGDVARAADGTSINRYGYRQYALQVSMASAAMAQNYAAWLLALYKDPLIRVSSLTIKPARHPDVLFPQVLGRELGDRITVKLTPPGGGSRITRDAIIRGISHSVTPSDWTTVWTFQDVSNIPSPFIVGTTTVGDTTTTIWF